MSSIAMLSFKESAEIKTAASKQKSHFQQPKNDKLAAHSDTRTIRAIRSLSQRRLNLPYMLQTLMEKHRLLS